MEIAIGSQYKDRKTGIIMTVTDRFKVYNSKNELVRVYYSARGIHGSVPVTAGDVCGITILRNLIK